jgi:aspartyl protease family protein
MRLQVIQVFLAILASSFAAAAPAQEVALTGILGSKALLIVDGAPPKAVNLGDSFRGVKVLSISSPTVEVEISGQKQFLRLGESPAPLTSNSEANSSNRKIVLHAGTGGHFKTQGKINGQAVNFMVDTGATAVGISVDEARRLGLKYEEGAPGYVNTANGVTQAWKITLDRVRVANVEIYGVDAVVSTGQLPFVLLGNSFLTRFQMTRINDQLILEQRY